MHTILSILLVVYGINVGKSIPLENYAGSSPIGLFVQAVTNASSTISRFPGISPEIRRALSEMYNDTNVGMGPLSDGNIEKCCGRYGCFTSIQSFEGRDRPLSVLPMCLEDLRIKLYMWMRENPAFRYVIEPEDSRALINLNFRNVHCIFIFIHGYLGRGDSFYIREMKDAILREKGCMFISVDWTFGARMVPHSSISNIEMVSAVVASVIQQIMDRYQINPKTFHLVGHGLGAHGCGGVGKRIPGIGRITALNPLKPYFENADSRVCLSKTDALFVDVIYTEISIFGMKRPIGHVNIYVNGGYSQPPCFGTVACSHVVSLFYFIDWIQASCPYYAYQCESWDIFMRGKCSLGCGHDNTLCVSLTDHVEEWKHSTKESPAIFYISAQASRGYCVSHYYVEINCTDDRIRLWKYGRNKDKLLINLIGANGETGLQLANENSIRFTTLNTITTMITSEFQIGKITGIVLKWIPSGGVLPDEHCRTQGIEEPTASCCLESNMIVESSRLRCLMCPYSVSSIYAKNLETGYSARYRGVTVFLSPNVESAFNLKNNLQRH